VSTLSPAEIIDSKVNLHSILDINVISTQMGARNYGKAKGNTVEWLVLCLRDQSMERALILLKIWVHDSKRNLCTKELVQEINVLPDKLAVKTLRLLQLKEVYLRKGNDRQLNVDVIITTLDTAKSYNIKALLDTGCMSLCISWHFISEKGIETMRYVTPIACYNADSTENKARQITDFVEM
jgi:hypothetical protein